MTLERIAEARIAIEQTRFLEPEDRAPDGHRRNKEARREIAIIRIAAPNMACEVVDWAIQAVDGAGTNNDYGLAAMYTTARLLRLATDQTRSTPTSSASSSSYAPAWSDQ